MEELWAGEVSPTPGPSTLGQKSRAEGQRVRGSLSQGKFINPKPYVPRSVTRKTDVYTTYINPLGT